MAVSKELADKVRKYQQLAQETEELFEKLEEEFQKEEFVGECAVIDNLGISIGEAPLSSRATPVGNGEYLEITTKFEDSEWGVHYFPVEDSEEYVAVNYST